ncbi:MAG: PAS domain-containing protein, partial [Myxococcota bacterium]
MTPLRRRATELAIREHATTEELRIHQIELELQNEELERTTVERSQLLERFRTVFDHAPVAMFELEAGLIVRANQLAVSLVPHRPSDPFMLLAAEGSRGAVLRMLQANGRRSHTIPLVGHNRSILAKVEMSPVEQNPPSPGDPEAEVLIVTVQDITEEVETRTRLEESERQLQRLWDAAPDAVAVAAEGEVLFCNAAFRELVELPADVGLGQHLGRFLSGGVALRLEAARGTTEVSLTTHQGAQRTVEVVTTPVHYARRSATVYAMRDLTERRELEASLARSERLASIGMLVAGVAHEINNPLA